MGIGMASLYLPEDYKWPKVMELIRGTLLHILVIKINSTYPILLQV